MINLYHAGYVVIEHPDIHYGRKNADFGQGFYTTDNSEFARRWAREKPGTDIIINSYSLDTGNLKVKEFKRDTEWFEYIFANRRMNPDIYADYDVIIGPIANDTIYDTLGIITSGFLSDEEAMKVLMVGPCFRQIVLKSERAASNLKFLSSQVLSGDDIAEARVKFAQDNELFQAEFATAMEELEKDM